MFDYIIIGAGSAGCVLANRLSANPERTVLLLEAGGPDDKPEIHIPFALTKLLQSEVDWAYETELQPNLNGRRLVWPRGKVLLGTAVQSDDDLQEVIRNHASTVFHPVGTCKMGHDPLAAGANASIIPTIPNGNTNAPAIMIGEKAAELILKESV